MKNRRLWIAAMVLLIFSRMAPATEPTVAVQQEKAEKTIRIFEKKPYTLSDPDVLMLKEELRTRCNLPPGNDHVYPWYYHYLLGLEFSKRNDWQRALDSFLVALDHRRSPQKFARIYGMWFEDYFPYYQIGVAHYHLQNWKCASNSFLLSQYLEDIPSNSPEAETRVLFDLESKNKIGN